MHPVAVAHLRFYAELNDLLPSNNRQRPVAYRFTGRPSIKDAIEGCGVPHTEVDLIVVDGVSVGFDYHLEPRDRVAIYPVFESLDVSPLVRLRPEPLRRTAFILDGHLGKLVRLLRMLGFDALYCQDNEDSEIVRLAAAEQRIILTRDRGLLKHASVTHGYCVRSQEPLEQAREILRRFDLYTQVKPLSRCICCNGALERVAKNAILSRLPPRTILYYDIFYRCCTCDHIYWPGSHYQNILITIAHLYEESSPVAGMLSQEEDPHDERNTTQHHPDHHRPTAL
jgi:uncharacterized protein with PIN domain